MSRLSDLIDIPLRVVVDGMGYANIFSPQTHANPNGWLILRQFTSRGPWYPATAFPLSETYSALRWFVVARAEMKKRNAGHDGVRLIFMDGSMIAEYVKFGTRKVARQ